MTVAEFLSRVDSAELSEWIILLTMKAKERKEAEENLRRNMGNRLH